jgi:hypothetical protein
MPKSIRKKQQINQKRPYFIATAASLVLGLFAIGFFYDSKVVSTKADAASQLTQTLSPLDAENTKLQEAIQKTEAAKKQLDEFTQNMDERFYWMNLFSEIRDALQATEAQTQEQGVRTGVWIETFAPSAPDFGSTVGVASAETDAAAESASAARRFYMMDPALRRRYGLDRAPTPEAGAEDASADGTAKKAATNEISTIELTCRAVNTRKTEAANFTLAQTLLDELRAKTNWFVATETVFTGDTHKPTDPSEPTFTFKINLKLARPVKL